MSPSQKFAQLERRVAALERRAMFLSPKSKVTLNRVRREFIERANRDGKIDYLQFWRETGYPYKMVEKVLVELTDKGYLADDG